MDIGRLVSLTLLASIITKTVWITLSILVLLTPHYILHGPLEASIALLWYRVSLLGVKLDYPLLDSIAVYSISIILADSLAVEGIYLAFLELLGRRLRPHLRGFLIATGMTLLVASSATSSLIRLEKMVVDRLSQGYMYATSAGTIVLGREEVTVGLPPILVGYMWVVAIVDLLLLTIYYVVRELFENPS